MTAPRVLRARYADWRPVKGRKVLQIVLEVPLEQQEEALTMLGAPLPDRDLWVALALLSDEHNADAFKGGKNAQRAGILCNEGAFQRWAGARCPDTAAAFIRRRCSVDSRKMLDHDEDAGRAFLSMITDYENWMRGIAA